MKRRWLLLSLMGIAIIAVLLAIFPEAFRDSRRPVRMKLVPDNIWATAVGYQYAGPPPWSKGNCFWFERTRWIGPDRKYQVANMDMENYRVIAKDQNITEVEVLLIGKETCLIVDPRIPRSWRRSYTNLCCTKDDVSEFKHEFRE